MIEYDYTIEKNDGYETKTFKPLFERSISNVATFRGHNSSGKSTFMDLVALSLYGIDSPEVISKLKEKLDYLKNAENSNFNFELKANNENVCIRVHSQKSGFIEGVGEWDCTVEESIGGGDFVELTKERFLRKYRVIYDMPDRPMERVQELVREAERIIGSTKDMVYSFRSLAIDETRKARDSRNENSIFLTKNELMSKKNNLSGAEDDLDQIKRLSKKIMQFYYASEFKMLSDEEEQLRNKIENLQKQKSQKQKQDKKQSDAYNKTLRSIKSQLKILVDEYGASCNKLSDLEKIDPVYIQTYMHFGDITPEIILRNGCSQLYDFKTASNDLIDETRRIYGDDKSLILVEKKKLLGELITALEPYITDDIKVLDSPVGTLYEKLDSEFREICDQLSEYEHIQSILSHMENAYVAAKEADKMYKNLGSPPVIGSVDEGSGMGLNFSMRRDAILQRIKEMKEDAAQYGVSTETYATLYENSHDDIFMKDFIGMSSRDLKERADEYSNKIKEKEEKIINLKSRIARLQDELEVMESKDPHPLSEYQSELDTLITCMGTMILDFDSKASMLNILSSGDKVTENEKNKSFLELVWSYLGKRLGSFQHIGQEYEVEKIDMNLRVMFTKSGARIPFKDMGTGESQLAYLSGLLSGDDGRITIALFDEIDHMDPDVISQLQHRLKMKYDEGKLLIGIMAAPALGTGVEPCE